MKFGIVTQGYVRKGEDERQRVREVILEAQAAERYGFDSFGMSEQHFKFPTNTTGALDVLFPWIAATTERIRLMPAAVITPLHHPLNIAERWATIDVLSGGRVDFAVGRGNTPPTFAAFEIDPAETNARTFEALEIIYKAWNSREPFSHHGEFWNFDAVRLTPYPLQSPPPAPSLASVSLKSCRMAGEHRLGWMGVTNNIEWHQIQAQFDAYREGWENGAEIPGTPPNSKITIVSPMHVAKTSKEARDQVEFGTMEYAKRSMKQQNLNQQLTYGTSEGTMGTTGQFFDGEFDELLERTPLAIGDPDYVIEKLLKLAEYGMDEIGLAIDYATHEELVENIRLAGEEVIPAVRQELAAREARLAVAK